MPESERPAPPSQQPHIRQGFFHLLSGSIIGRGLSFAANLLISRTLGPGNLGIVNLILSTAQTVEMTVRSGVDFGLSYALTGEGATLSDARQAHIAHAALRVVQGSTLLVGLAVWLWVMPFGGLLGPQGVPKPSLSKLAQLRKAVKEGKWMLASTPGA